MENSFNLVVEENLTELVQVTGYTLEFCNRLKETGLVTNSQHQKFLSFLVRNIHTRYIWLYKNEASNFLISSFSFQSEGQYEEGATFIYTTIVRTFNTENEKTFKAILNDLECFRALEILNGTAKGNCCSILF